MRGSQLIGAGALALALATGFVAPAQAADASAAKDNRAEWRTATANVAKAGDEVFAACPADTTVIYGRLDQVLAPVTVVAGQGAVYRSEADTARNGWIVRVDSTNRTDPWEITVGVNCAKPGWETGRVMGEEWIIEEPHTLTSSGQEFTGQCPAGTMAFGAGAHVLSSGATAEFARETSDGSARVWRICFDGGATGPVDVVTRVYCP